MMTANTTYFYSIENYKKSKTKAKNHKKTNIIAYYNTTVRGQTTLRCLKNVYLTLI